MQPPHRACSDHVANDEPRTSSSCREKVGGGYEIFHLVGG